MVKPTGSVGNISSLDSPQSSKVSKTTSGGISQPPKTSLPNRQSGRLQLSEQTRVIDDQTKQRRLRKQLDNLERDNVQDDPHANLIWNKAVPKFADDMVGGSTSKSQKKQLSQSLHQGGSDDVGTKKGKKLRAELTKTRFRKNFSQLIEEEQKLKEEDPETPTYSEVRAPPSAIPARKFCSVCGLFSKYTCSKCSSHFCSISCKGVHLELRCLKWTS